MSSRSHEHVELWRFHAREVIENLLKECQVMKRSGIHFDACNDRDLLKIVNNLVDQNALSEEKGRKYKTLEIV